MAAKASRAYDAELRSKRLSWPSEERISARNVKYFMVIAMSKIIGLTGGIATGKSAVSQYLAAKQIPIIDADKVAHQVQQPGQAGLAAIVRAFGKAVLTSDGSLDRERLGQLVFGHPERLNQLVSVMDPYIRETILNQLARYHDHKLVVIDAPTLFENGYTYLAAEIMVVYCDPVTQMKRLMKRNHLTIAQAAARMKSQWPLQTKCDLADTIIYNSGSLAHTNEQIDKWLENEME